MSQPMGGNQQMAGMNEQEQAMVKMVGLRVTVRYGFFMTNVNVL